MLLSHIPNILTISRIVFLPVLIALFFIPGAVAAWAALLIYTFCAVTDFLDGWIARRYKITSKFGTFLDPISDKILVACVLFMLAAVDRLDGLWIIPALVILTREFLISGLREFLGPKNITIPVSSLAKWKTAIQMVALGFLVIGDFGNILVPNTLLIGQIGLSVAALFTVITGWGYIKAAAHHLRA